MKTKYYHILNAFIVDDYILKIVFSDTFIQTVDFGPFLKSSTNPQITKYLDTDLFWSFEIKEGELIWGDYDLLFPIHQLREGKIA